VCAVEQLEAKYAVM